MSLFVVLIIAVLMSLGLDATNGWRNRTYLTSVADMGAHAGAVAIAHKKTDEEIIADVQMVIETNMPTDFWGNVVDADTDIVLADYDVETKTWAQGTLYRPNAVIVHVERTKSRGNAVSTFLMQFIGINSLDVQAVSAGVFDRSGLCSATDGIYGVGRVRISSQGYFGGGICIHSEDYVWLPQQNTFEENAYVSMPDLALCEDKCTDEANPGINPLEYHMFMPDFGEYILQAVDDFAGGINDSQMKYEFFTDDPFDPHDANVTLGDLTALITANVLTAATAGDVTLGAVIELTHAQFHAIPQLPSGLVYTVDCPDNGNGSNTTLVFNATTGQMEDAVLTTDCSLDFDTGSRVAGSVVITTRNANTTVVQAGPGTEIGDPLQSCMSEDRAVVMSMSPVTVPSDFIQSNVTLIVDDDVNIASSTSSGSTSVGFAVYASGLIDIASQHSFYSCGTPGDILQPLAKILRLVIPPTI